jgi:hypothetical protein
MHMAMLKGHPNNPPSANQNTPSAVRKPRRRSINAAVPSIVVYMANVDGKNAAAAWNMPALVMVVIKYRIPTRRLMFVDTAVYSLVSQNAQKMASRHRRP